MPNWTNSGRSTQMESWNGVNRRKIKMKAYVGSIVCAIIIIAIISFCIGYVKGFKRSKEIDDKIISEIGARLHNKN